MSSTSITTVAHQELKGSTASTRQTVTPLGNESFIVPKLNEDIAQEETISLSKANNCKQISLVPNVLCVE